MSYAPRSAKRSSTSSPTHSIDPAKCVSYLKSQMDSGNLRPKSGDPKPCKCHDKGACQCHAKKKPNT